MSTVPVRSWSEIRASGTLNDPIGRPWSYPISAASRYRATSSAGTVTVNRAQPIH